ncbi:MAG TPA: hypothetical protein VF549_16185 [Solirubrobacteraceae bacterium]|jgi:hypothetical protein
MIDTAKNLVTGAAGALGGAANTVARTVSARGSGNPRAEAAQKAAATRKRTTAKRSEAAQKAAQTRKAKAAQRSATAKKAARTRKQRDDRVAGMVEATKQD